MKILCESMPLKYRYLLLGWKSAAEALGHQFDIWDKNVKPAFDMFDELRPNTFLHHSELTEGLDRCLKSHKNTKPIYVEKLLPAFDPINWVPQEPSPLYRSFHSVIDNFNSELLPVIRDISDLKIYGHIRWPVANYLGVVSIKEACQIYASSDVCVDFSDITLSERYYQITGLGRTYFSYLPNRKYTLFGPTEKSRLNILENETYFHRLADVFERANMEREAKRFREHATERLRDDGVLNG